MDGSDPEALHHRLPMVWSADLQMPQIEIVKFLFLRVAGIIIVLLTLTLWLGRSWLKPQMSQSH